jgi:hypothetical protein
LVAIAPTAAPRANGVRIDENEKIVSIRASSRSVEAPARNAYVPPRKMIPNSAMKRTTASVEAIDPNALGYEVQNTVRTKISHTWLASHTGPIER